MELDQPASVDVAEVEAGAPISQKARTLAAECAMFDVTPVGLAVHPCPIYSIAATKNMKWMFTGGDDGFIRKYDFMASMNGDALLTAVQKHGLVDSVQRSGVMTSAWELEEVPSPPKGVTPDLSAAAPAPASKISPVYSMAIHSEAVFMLAGCESGNINLFSVRHDEGQCQHVLRHHDKPVSVLTLSGDEKTLMSGSWDRRAIRWDLNTGTAIREFKAFNSHITTIQYKPNPSMPVQYDLPDAVDDHAALILSFDGRASIVDHRDPNEVVKSVATLSGVPNSAPPWGVSASWSPDGHRFFIGRRNGTVDEYDFGEGKLLQSIRLPRDSGAVTSVHCMPNNRHVLCCSFDNIRLWDLQYTPPEPTEPGGTVSASMNLDSEFLQPIVPFSIIPGHHGGVIAATHMDWSSRYMITVSGNRGWDGTANNMCLLYSVNSAQA
ncbi:Transcription factor spt8 [Chytriomyces hyalinus]|nr:Transcription factor spt8 [Chytriomyces hyalinus]